MEDKKKQLQVVYYRLDKNMWEKKNLVLANTGEGRRVYLTV